MIASDIFRGRGVRLVFVSACRSAQTGAAGICRALVESGSVPVALGWGASIADDWATDFATVFYRELAIGDLIDTALAIARGHLLDQGRRQEGEREWLDASFALPQLYSVQNFSQLIDESLPEVRPSRSSVQYQRIGDNIRGLKQGFVGRRR